MRIMGRASYLIAFLMLLDLASDNRCQAAALGVANAYNVFVFNNFSETGADTGGRIAAGGTVSFNGTYAVTQSLLDTFVPPLNDALVIDSNIISGNANLFHGNAYLGALPKSVYMVGGGSVTVGGGVAGSPIGAGTSAVGVAAQAPSLIATSTQLSQLTANGTVANNGYGTINLNGTDPTLDVFDLNISTLASGTFNLNDPSTATVIINVIGASVTTTNWGMYINGQGVNGDSTTGATKVLWNFYQATSLTFGGGFLGTVLAPNADVIGTNGQQLDGGLIAKSFSGSTEFHDLLFTGTLPPTSTTPEPAPFALCGGALVLAGLVKRRRK